MSAEKVVYNSVPQKDQCEEPPVYKPPDGFGTRHTQALILFICLTVGYSLRAHLSVSMVAMTNVNNTSCYTRSNVSNGNENEINETAEGAVCGEANASANGWSVYRTYNWNKATQEMILYSFFVGYTSMMIPMGILAQRVGGKIPIMIALGANGVLSILTPWVPIFGGWLGVCFCRLLQGMTQAAFYPSIHTLLGKWAPLSERGRLSTYVYTGGQFGTVLAFQLAGLFAGSATLGWPSSFWLGGSVSLICFCFLGWLGAATPHEHPNISFEELAYIVGDISADAPKKRRTPWKHILSSAPVYGLVATHAGSAVGFLLILTQLPLYMHRILNVDIRKNGVYGSLGYIAMYFMTLMFGYLSDFCVNRRIMSVANIRRVANTTGMVLSGLFLVAFGFVKDTMVAVILLILCLGTHSGVHVGFHINHIDLAPNFAGPIMALGNMIANLTSLLAPVLVSNIIGDDVSNQRNWQILFIIIAVMMIVSNLIFVIFVKGTVQPWNYSGEDGTTKNEICVQKEKNDVIVITKETVTKS